MTREQLPKPQSDTESLDEQAVADQQDQGAADVAERKEQLDDDIDAILDEIDDVLEVNAEDFVKAFIQKGGQ
jgi:ubiquitin-like protein Pup